jgi:hypothetical protein
MVKKKTVQSLFVMIFAYAIPIYGDKVKSLWVGIMTKYAPF